MANLIKNVPGAGDNLAYKLTNKTVNIADTSIAHGLPFTPTTIIITPTSLNTIALVSIDATNIVLRANADGATCNIDVLG